MKLKMLIVCCCLLTMAGCSQSENKPGTAVVDLAPYRCPPLRSADRKLFQHGPRRAPDGPLTEARLKAWVDGLEGQIAARNAAGRRVIGEYDHCRRDKPETS